MRVISGTARGRKLKEPAGGDVRPTSDMVKESIFNIIQFDIEGRRVLDLFAGTGQLGIEALSRGAERAVFIDSSPAAVKLIKENVNKCGFESRAEVICQDALAYLKQCPQFDIIFLDPPYDSTLFGKTLEKIIEIDKLRENGIIICETKSDSKMPEAAEPYSLLREYRYGGVKITRYGKLAALA